jgi:hypothetical protein
MDISLGCLCPGNVERRRIGVELELRLSVVALAEVADERAVALASTPQPEAASKYQHKHGSLAHLAETVGYLPEILQRRVRIFYSTSSFVTASGRSSDICKRRMHPRSHPSARPELAKLPRPLGHACPAGKKRFRASSPAARLGRRILGARDTAYRQ